MKHLLLISILFSIGCKESGPAAISAPAQKSPISVNRIVVFGDDMGPGYAQIIADHFGVQLLDHSTPSDESCYCTQNFMRAEIHAQDGAFPTDIQDGDIIVAVLGFNDSRNFQMPDAWWMNQGLTVFFTEALRHNVQIYIEGPPPIHPSLIGLNQGFNPGYTLEVTLRYQDMIKSVIESSGLSNVHYVENPRLVTTDQMVDSNHLWPSQVGQQMLANDFLGEIQ